MLALGRWGASRLGEPGPDGTVTSSSLMMMMRSAFRRGSAYGMSVTYELRMDSMVLHLRIADGELTAVDGSIESPPASSTDAQLARPDLVIVAGPSIVKLMSHEITAAEAVARGIVTITGPIRLLEWFAVIFRI
jgi:hypothetical protein